MMEHRITLGSGFGLWREVRLRAAGLAADRLAALASPDLLAGDHLEERYPLAERRAADALDAAAADPLLREAVSWQNPNAIATAFDKLRAPEGDRRAREHRQLIARYLQRYCAKNDTIGFFGAAAWGQLDPDGPPLVVVPRRPLFVERRVYFESWGPAALAEAFARDPELRPALCPRRRPTIRLHGDRLHHAGGTATLAPALAWVLAQASGEEPAASIAERGPKERSDLFAGPAEVVEALEILEESELIRWSLDLPIWQVYPERTLASVAATLPESAPKRRLQQAIGELEVARDRLAGAAGDAAAVQAGLVELGACFERWTGTPAARRPGQTYAGRTVAFEDCTRNLELRLGAALLTELDPPLSLLLLSARWFTASIAERYRRVLLEAHQALGGDVVPFPAFWLRVEPAFAVERGSSPIVAAAAGELARRWAELLAPGRVEIAAIAARAGELFAAEQPGWPMACWHSPDLLIAADPKSAAGGRWQLVLGELHVAVNTFFARCSIAQHTDPLRLWTAAEQDLPARGVVRVESRFIDTRAHHLPPRRDAYHLERHWSRSPAPAQAVLAAGDLEVIREADQLWIRHREQRLLFRWEEVFDAYLSAQAASNFSLLPPAEHRPRVSLGDLVVNRARWSVQAPLPFAAQKRAVDRWRGLHDWAEARGMPRLLFAKPATEPKPFLLDRASPVSVELFCKAARKPQRIELSEMLPDLEQLWLEDADGARYTSELRLVAVDPIAWSSTSTSRSSEV
jgi:hypothetical protein